MLSFGFAFLAGGAIGGELRIRSVDDFIQFRDNVDSGTNYYGTTVFLDSDIDFAGKTFEPIGNYSNYFNGTFDGQGHVISNLAMTSSSIYVGLFGYSWGLTIRNVILDSSCSITSSYGSGSVYIGGIIGHCDARNGPCTIENSANMGSVTFSGYVSSSYYLHLGGIAGYLSFYDFDSTVKNCANYGDVTHSGKSKDSCIGGIVGWSSNSSSNRVYIYNSLNHGTITHNGTTSDSLWVGGIAGQTDYTTIENCVSGGKISLLTTARYVNYIGGIGGYVSSDTSINYTYFASDLSGYDKYGYIESNPVESNTLSYDSTSFELHGTVSIGSYSGSSLIGALNAYTDYYTLRNYPHWLLNKGNNAVSFTINKNSPFALNSQVILLPSLASEGNTTFRWYEDKECTVPFEKATVEEGVTLYGKYGSEKSMASSLFPYATLLLSFLISLIAF